MNIYPPFSKLLSEILKSESDGRAERLCSRVFVLASSLESLTKKLFLFRLEVGDFL